MQQMDPENASAKPRGEKQIEKKITSARQSGPRGIRPPYNPSLGGTLKNGKHSAFVIGGSTDVATKGAPTKYPARHSFVHRAGP